MTVEEIISEKMDELNTLLEEEIRSILWLAGIEVSEENVLKAKEVFFKG